MDFGIKEGLKNVKEYVVEHKDTADAVGNKGINVLSSPTMILWIEQTCLEAVKPLLPEGYETVGTLSFDIKVYDEKGKICKGTHGRAIVNKEQFFGNL